LRYYLWGKKNPFLSLWLSSANAVLGATRSQATAALHRQMNAATTECTRQVLAFWGMNTPSWKRRVKRQRSHHKTR